MQFSNIRSTLTQLWYLLNKLVPSLPAHFIISSTPPGWKLTYGVMLKTFPFIQVQQSDRLLCFFNSSLLIFTYCGGGVDGSTPLNLCLGWVLFKCAQSNGEWPGCSTTFCRARAWDEGDVNDGDSEDAVTSPPAARWAEFNAGNVPFETVGGGRSDSDGGLSELLEASPWLVSPTFLLNSSRLETISDVYPI